MRKKSYRNLTANFRAVILLGFCVFSATLFAADINWDELEEKAKRYTGETGLDKKLPGAEGGKSIDLVIPSQPPGRAMETPADSLSEADKKYITVHMKLANRHFSKKNYQRAIEEVELVFEREPDNAGGRFMRAVIAARLKDHATAWHNIVIARDKDPQNAKVTTFIDKLKTVAPEPQKTASVAGIYRPIPISACEKAADIIERFLQHPSSQNVTTLTTGELTSEAGSIWLTINLEASAVMPRAEIIEILKKASGGKVEAAAPTTSENVDKNLQLKIEITGMDIENKSVKPVSELREFIKDLTEEIDVAISDTVEVDAENKVLDTTYEVSVRDFKVLNDFLRKISPFAHKFRVLSMKLAYITGSQSIIWKCKVQVFYQQT